MTKKLVKKQKNLNIFENLCYKTFSTYFLADKRYNNVLSIDAFSRQFYCNNY